MPVAEPRITIPLRTRDQRVAERFDVNMPVQVEGHATVTQDLSTHGVGFDSDRPYAPGDRIQVTIEYLMDGHDFPLQCEAVVARCERDGDKYKVGARLIAPFDGIPETTVP
jgi:hypothetical protein